MAYTSDLFNIFRAPDVTDVARQTANSLPCQTIRINGFARGNGRNRNKIA